MNTDQIAAEAAWTDDTVYDLLAEAFESGGEIRGGQLIAQRHNETVQSAIEKATEPFKRQLESAGDLESEIVRLAESRAAHASEQGAVYAAAERLIHECSISGDSCTPFAKDIALVAKFALSQRPTPRHREREN